MRQRARIAVAAAFWALLAGFVSVPLADEDGGAETPEAVTTGDPEIPVEELALLLKPLTKAELLIEADAWQALLKEKAEEIARAEIAVQRQNLEIEKAKDIQDKAEEAKEQLQEVKETAEEARSSGDMEKVKETEEAARDAHEKLKEVGATVDEAAEAAEKTAEIQEQANPELREGLADAAAAAEEADDALGRVREAVGDADPDSEASIVEAAGKAGEAAEEAREATEEVGNKAAEVAEKIAESADKEEVVEEAAQAMERAEDATKEQKVELLETVNDLREERTVLIDRLKAVLDELETKTDKEDADTLAKVTDYRLYISSVQGIRLDVKDTTSTWIAVKGWLTSEEGGLRWAQNVALFIGILVGAWILSKILSRAVHRGLKMAGKVSQLLENFLVGTVRWVVMAVGVIMALAALEVSIGPLLAVVGAAGFVIAFALQDSLSNFASGLMILFFRPFDVGDVVDAGGVSGKVTTMNLVSTTIKTFDNKDMVVPNNKIWQDVITNATGVDTRRVDMEFGIGYDDDVDKAQAILEEIVAAHPKALKDPEPTIRLNTLADSSVNFICRPWARTADYWDVYWDVTKAVKQRFDAEGIGIPFPQRDVHLYIEGGAGKEPLAGVSRGATVSGGANPQPYELDADKEGGPES
jgi:small conductance mechanosensitive channel